MASSGYLRGKVVCVDCRDYGDKSGVESMRSMEEIWQSFKMKPFVLIGSHRGEAGAEKIKRIAEGLKLTYPIYRDADIVRTQEQRDADPERTGYLYVVGSTGKVFYRGKDERRVQGVVASAVMAMRSPQTPKQWKYYIDFDVDVLPGRAYLEIEEFRKAFPKEAAAYDDVWERFNADSADLKKSQNPLVAQEAKNCIADLTWTAATLKSAEEKSNAQGGEK